MAAAGAPAVTDAFGVIAHPVRRQIVAEITSLHSERLDEVRNWLAVLDASWAGALRRLGQHLERAP